MRDDVKERILDVRKRRGDDAHAVLSDLRRKGFKCVREAARD